ncbi:magnesium transporter CorA family protein [Mycobacterium sp. OTB74]|jgi:magnesium transporter|uniref:magnesium transporter CorA family protein n=1 Tax=Mycobacterium sp. OTB74 TaxID=1853452 RepID=UPI002474C8BB|nr:magnesium transporter CorA family protein [Mycobacterium sp. OTB74]MDH6247193.1 Mg2+ and Co2+ transporter CorA [Mycobacterium sp. OTB74]
MTTTPSPSDEPPGQIAEYEGFEYQGLNGSWTHKTRPAFESGPLPSTAQFTEAQIEHLSRWMHDGLRSRMEIKDDYLVALFLVPVLDAHADTVWMRKISILTTHHSVLTVDDTPEGRPPLDLDTVVTRFRSCPDRSPGRLVYVLIDEIARAFTELADGFEAEINEIEDALDDSHPHRASDGEWFRKRLQRFRSDLYDVRSALIPTEHAVHFIIVGEDLTGAELFPRDIEDKLRDTYDRLRYVSESLDVVRDEIGGLRDYLQARIGNEQNEIMKALTIVAALVLIPTFVVGFYGQNFEYFPGLHGKRAFWAVCLVMLAIVMSEIWYLWHRGWIGRGLHRRDIKRSGR